MQVNSYKFAEFELDPARFELRRNGLPVKLERIPMELLILLAEKDGAVVSRQEIVNRLWGKDVFVDTEHGINTAIRKIRAALREDAEKARFVQTVPGKGYRFVAEVSNGAKGKAVPAETIIPNVAASPLPSPVPVLNGRARWKVAAAAIMMAAVLAATWGLWYQRRGVKSVGRIQSIAVLPLANLSGDATQDYFSDGITDELITMLARETSLRVVSRTSVMQYKGVSRPLREVARELRVDSILEGSVTRVGDQVHVTVQLIRAADDSHIWAESYDRDAKSAFTLPAEVASRVGEKVGAALSASKPQRFVSPEAHDAYLRGRYLWFTDDQKRALEYFEQAVALQPDYAAAWSGLADAYMVEAVSGSKPAQEVRERAADAVHKAVELDDSSGQAHLSLGAYYLFMEWNWNLADLESKRAIELAPQLSEAYHLRSYVMFAMNRPEEALKAQLRSTEIDPFARPWALGRAYIMLRQYDAAIKELLMQRDARPSEVWPHYFLSRAYMHKGMWKESVNEIEEGLRLRKDEQAGREVREAYLRGGGRAVQMWFLESDLAHSKRNYVSPLSLARDFAILQRKEETLAMLEAAYRERSPQLIFLQFTPEFDFVHNEPRYRKIVKDMNMDPAY